MGPTLESAPVPVITSINLYLARRAPLELTHQVVFPYRRDYSYVVNIQA